MGAASSLDEQVWQAHADVWQAQGRLRIPAGGGAGDLPGIRLMASGLPFAQWNSGDVTDAAAVDVDAVRRWYAARAGGRGVPWGVRVPHGTPWRHGRLVTRLQCMALPAGALRPGRLPSTEIRLRRAGPSDAAEVARVDAAAFGDPVGPNRGWVAPQLGADGFDVVVAEVGSAVVGSAVVGTATGVRTRGRAGPAMGVFGVGVLPEWRRRGIGAALTCALVTAAEADGAMLTHLTAESDDAARLYAGLGFEATAPIDVYVEL